MSLLIAPIKDSPTKVGLPYIKQSSCVVAQLHKSGIPYKEMAILVRKGKEIASASSALDRAGIPFETDSAEHFFAGDYFNRFWMLAVIEESGYMSASEGCINRVVHYLANGKNAIINKDEFRLACYVCNVDPDFFILSNLYKMKKKLNQLI